MLQLYDLNKIKIKGLTKYRDVKVEKELSGEEVLSFSYPQNLSENIKEETYVRTKENEYVIKEVSKSDDWTGFIAKVNVETIKGNPFNHYESKEQTCTYAVNLALAGTGWTIGSCDVTKRRTVRKTNCSSYEILQEIRKVYRCDFKFNAIEKKIYIYQSIGSDKGTYFIDQLNLKKLDIQSNSHDFCTRIIPLGKDGLDIKSINNGKEYVENYQYSNKIITKYWEDNRYTVVSSLKEDAELKLKELSTPRKAYKADIIDLARVSTKYTNILEYSLGDTITLISKDKKVKEKQRIIKLIEYPDEPEKNSCEIANRTLTLEDLQVDFIEATDTVNSVTTTDGMLDNSKIDFNPIRMEVESIVATKIDVQELNAVEIRVGNLIGTKANITDLDAEVARINQAFIKTATIENLNATNGKITLLETKVGSIDTILSKEIFAELISAGKIVAGSSIIAESAIGSAQINSLDLNKLNAGSIDTSKIQLIGPNGRLRLTGNKLQIFDTIDGQQYERVMLGVDDSNNSTIVLRGADGKTVLLNQDGLTKPGFTDGYNKLDDNSLPGTKLDINSVIRAVNTKGTETIAGTKVTVGDRTLDVELSTQKNLIDSANKELSTQKATVSAMDNAIKLKVDNQTFNNFKSTTEGNIVTVTTNLNKATSSIDVLQKSITLKVSQDEVDKSIKELEIGVRNLLRRSKLDYVPTSSTGTGTISEVVNDSLQGMVLHTNKQYVHGVELYVPKESLNVGDQITLSMLVRAKSKGIFTCQLYNTATISDMITISPTTEWQWLSYTKTIVGDPNSKDSRLYIYFTPDNEYWIKCIKIEKGNKATNWTPALEDTDQAISTIDTKINTKVGEINISLDGVTTRVGKTESATTTIDGKVNTLSTRVSNAERKITPEGIVATVTASTAYKGDLNSKANQTALTTAESKIVHLSGLISQKVESKDFISYKSQTTTELAQRVTKGEFGSLFKQNVDGFDFGFGQSAAPNLIRNSTWYRDAADWAETSDITGGIIYPKNFSIRDGSGLALRGAMGKQSYVSQIITGGFGQRNKDFILTGYLAGELIRPGGVSPYNGIEVSITYEDNTATYHSVPGADIPKSSWTYFEFPFVAKGLVIKQIRILVLMRHMTGTLYVSGLKLAEGTKATAWSPNPNEITSTSVSITDAEGLVIKNNAVSVISKTGRTAFKVDDEGYVYNEYGIKTQAKPGEVISVLGKTLADDQCSTLLRPFGLWHESINDRYNLRIASKTEIWIKNLADEWQDIRCKWAYASQFRTTYNNDAGVILRDNCVDSGTGRIWINWGGGSPGNISKTLIGDGMSAGAYGELHCGSLYTHGTKNRAVETEHFGIRALGAYETPTPYFGDISRQVYEVIDGQCIVPLEPIFKETITSTGEYQVFFSKYGPGDIWTSEMYPTYFVVIGANIKFSWEIKAIQKGYENHRLEQVQI